MYDLLMKWQTTFLLLFGLLIVVLGVVLLVSAAISARKAKPPEDGDKGVDEDL